MGARWQRPGQQAAATPGGDQPGDHADSRLAQQCNASRRARCFDRAHARLRALVAGLPSERHVIQGDLLNRKVLVRASRITAVIGWATCCTVTG